MISLHSTSKKTSVVIFMYGFIDTTIVLSHAVRSVGVIWPRYPHNTKQTVNYTALTISYFARGFGLQQIRIRYVFSVTAIRYVFSVTAVRYVFSVTATLWYHSRHKFYSAYSVSGGVFVLTTALQRRIEITVEPRSVFEARLWESPVKE